MLTGITTRASTPQEDAEPWPGWSAGGAVVPVLAGSALPTSRAETISVQSGV